MALLLLAVWLILVGINWAGWVAISASLLGILALITGIVLLVENRGVVSTLNR